MTISPHDLPLVARQALVDQVIDRLLRPDDVRERPDKFIQPGFYGLGGIGKSRLLREIEARAQRITPYVVAINFDRRQAAYTPGTAWEMLNYLMQRLAEIDRAQRNPLQRLRGASGDPFRECWRIIAETGAPTSNEQTISAAGGSVVSGVQMNIAEQAIPPNLKQAFDRALAGLSKPVRVRREYGGFKPEPRPVVVILLDTLETAAKPLQAWLPAGLPGLLAGNLHSYHTLVVAAGRQEMQHFVTRELPALTRVESIEFLRHYYSHQQTTDQRFADVALQHTLREDTPTRRLIIELAAGIPLLLQLLADLTAQSGGRLLAAPAGPWPAGQQARISYVVEHYIKRLAVEANNDEDLAQRYHLLLYNAIPRRIPSEGLLAALWRDQPGAGYTAQTDYRTLWNHLSRESFVQEQVGRGLVYHEVIRTGLLNHLKATDSQRWRDLHSRAAAWWQAEPDEAERLYHALQADHAATMSELRDHTLAALDARNWPLAQAMISVTTELELTPEDQAWLTLFKAQLAWGEGNPALAMQRFARLTAASDLPAALAERLAVDLENCFRFSPEVEAEAIVEYSDQALPLVVWWARARAKPRLQAAALCALGEAALEQYRPADAEQHYQHALQLSRAIGDRLGEANALRGLGEAARMQDRPADAEQHYQHALQLSHAIGDRLGEARALLGLGHAALRQDRPADAEQHYQHALQLYRAIGHRRGEARALDGLGAAALKQDRPADAEQHCQHALQLSRAIGDRLGEANALDGLGDAALRQDRPADAEQHYQHALQLSHAIGDRLGEANALSGLGDAALQQDRPADAEQHCLHALQLYRAIGHRRGEANALLGLGHAALRQGRPADAEQHYQHALQLYHAIGDRLGEANALRGLGAAALKQDRPADAEQHCLHALQLSRAIGHRLGEANALRGLGDAALQQSHYTAVRAFFEQAFTLYLAIAMPQETLRFALSRGQDALDQMQHHREQDDDGLMLQASALAHWLLQQADQAYHRTDRQVAAQYNLPLQALRVRLAADQPDADQALVPPEQEFWLHTEVSLTPQPNRKPIRQLKIKTRRPSP